MSRCPTRGDTTSPGLPAQADRVYLCPDQIALCLAVSADAAVRLPPRYRQRYAVFAFRKDRKVERLRGLLSRLGITASDTVIANGYRSMCFHLPEWIPGRELPWSWVADATAEQR